jgi:hypothetical protein
MKTGSLFMKGEPSWLSRTTTKRLSPCTRSFEWKSFRKRREIVAKNLRQDEATGTARRDTRTAALNGLSAKEAVIRPGR